MAPVNRTGMDRRFVFFALLSVLFAALLIPGFGFVASMFIETGAGPENDGDTGIATIYMITVALGLGMTVLALPVTLPASIGLWIASHWFLFRLYSEKWRIRIAAIVSGLAGCAGFIFWFATFSQGESVPFVLVLVLVIGVLIGAVASAEIVYRPSKREPA